MDKTSRRCPAIPKDEYPDDLDPTEYRLKKDPCRVDPDESSCLYAVDQVDVDQEEVESISYSTSYCVEWDRLFAFRPDGLRFLREYGMSGRLRSCRFRSVCWRLYLGILSADRSQWVSRCQEWRDKYDYLKKTLDTNPRQVEDPVPDLSRHHPLSQAEDSPWNQFFQDHELRCTIAQDVIRTYPSIEFFHVEKVRNLMVQLLFLFAKHKPDIAYRQGMHELLAPLIFVLHCDHQAFEHACEIEQVGELLKEILNPAYIEHDAFAMFCQIMDTAQDWYVSKEISPTARFKAITASEPFVRTHEYSSSNVIVHKLSRIHGHLLRHQDPVLHAHLTRLEILPQVYGIRWLRLLFGREFPMQDLLVLWDAIFADHFDLVDYIFVSMLLYLRDALLSSDMSTCLHLLMKFPPVGDINYFIQKALNIRDPRAHPCPPTYTYQKPHSLNYSSYGDYLPLNGLQTTLMSNLRQANKDGRNSLMLGFSTLGKKLTPRPTSRYSFFGQPLKKAASEATLAEDTVQATVRRDRETTSHSASVSRKGSVHGQVTSEGAPGSPACSPRVEEGVAAETLSPEHRYDAVLPRSPNDTPHPQSKKVVHHSRYSDLEQRVSFLRNRVTDMDVMCLGCAERMDECIDKLQSSVLRRTSGDEDQLLLALAGLKQVRDVLKGTLRPASLFSYDSVADSHYRKIESVSRSPGTSVQSSPDSSETGGADSVRSDTLSVTPDDEPPRTPSAILNKNIRSKKEVEMYSLKNYSAPTSTEDTTHSFKNNNVLTNTDTIKFLHQQPVAGP